MPLIDRALVGVVVVLIAAILAGLTVRRRLGTCVTFVIYLTAVAVADAALFVWPERLFRRDFWIAKESVYNGLKLAIAVELMARIFGHFPSAYASVRRAVVVVVTGLAVLIWYSLAAGTEYESVVGRLYPHVTDATVWVLMCLGGYSLWYHLPLDSMQKAILIGLVPFLLVYSVVQRAVADLGWERSEWLNLSAPVAYLALLVYWAVVAWRVAPGADSAARVRDLRGRR